MAKRAAQKNSKTAPPPDETAERDAILLAALPDVPFDGWTPALLIRAAQRQDLTSDRIEALFPAGVASLLSHFADWADREMERRVAVLPLDTMRVRDRITAGVMARLDALHPYKQAVSAALGRSVDPRLGVRLSRHLWRSADALWWLAGDTSTDWNHYSKRGLLSGVFASTTLYWLSDTSDNYADTKAFLDRRIDEVLTLGRSLGTWRDTLSRVTSPFTPRRRKTPA